MRKLGVRILGSSFKGWTTEHMGFNTIGSTGRNELLGALLRLALGDLRCHYVELVDRWATGADGDGLPVTVQPASSF